MSPRPRSRPPWGSRLSRRTLVLLVTAAVLLLGVGALVLPGRLAQEPGCGADVVAVGGARSSSPFLDAPGRAERPDPDRDALVAAMESTEDPLGFGEVVGAVGYHYEQWARLSSFEQGLGVRTRDNPDFTMLDDRTLRPLWSVKVRTARSTWDASDERYLVTTLPGDRAPELVALDADDGRRVWCARLGGSAVGEQDALATQVLDDQSVAVLSPGDAGTERVQLRDGAHGGARWKHAVQADEGDFLGSLGEDVLLAGGAAQFRLFDPAVLADRLEQQALAALDAATGEELWSHRTPAGTAVHVVGTDPASGLAVLVEWARGGTSGRLLAVDRTGAEVWSARPPVTTYFDSALRAGRILVRAGDRFSAYDLASGRELWTRTVPAQPQFLPYGFELDTVTLLDPEHALLGTTEALRSLDLRDGSMTSLALPTDGISTTHWPYQVTVTPGLVAVATNTGTVVVRRPT